ncbi:tyrosine-type recombinase/integrase [Candidatus Uabimicrobium sp. HlEnr_7]|uniref:tyrosine-type recombinase/integrase n=1 Tax=Candidatus Uabimicrobium helgolandensis TaxID=3095367 RepID=UPI003555C7C1
MISINDAVVDFLIECQVKSFSKRTILSYKSSMKRFQEYTKQQGIEEVSDINKKTISNYQHYLQAEYIGKTGKNLATSTRCQNLTCLKSFFNYCSEQNYTVRNYAEIVVLPKIPKKLPKGVLSKQQIKKLLKAPDIKTLKGYRDRVIMETFYATGIRRQELEHVTIKDCYLKERQLFINKGKGNKQRWVPLGKKITNILKKYLKNIRPKLVKQKTHDFLIVGDKGGPMRGYRMHYIIAKYFKMLGIEGHCHGLRHSCATHLLKGKANIRVIQQILGHTSLSSTQIYTHIDISDLTKAIDKHHPREDMECSEN